LETDHVLPVLEGVKPAEILFEEAKAKKEARKEARRLAAMPKPEQPPTPEEIKAIKELDEKITAIKERGNLFFKNSNYIDAIEQFTEGIKIHEEAGSPLRFPDLKLKITQLFTNRCLCYHLLNR